MFDNYSPRPIHIVIPVILLLLASIVLGYFTTWQAALAFIGVLVVCVYTGIWIAYAGMLTESTENYRAKTESIEAEEQRIYMLKTTDRSVWYALGYIAPPDEVTIHNNVTGTEGKGDIFAMENTDLDISPTQMQKLADELLSGTRSLAETDWTDTIAAKKFRRVKQQMFAMKLINYANLRNDRAGFILTEKGKLFLLQFASVGVKQNPDLQILISMSKNMSQQTG